MWHRFITLSDGDCELYCLFIAADSVVDAISFSWCIMKSKSYQILSKSGSGRISVPKSIQERLSIRNSEHSTWILINENHYIYRPITAVTG